METWILCPNLWGARLFAYVRPPDGPSFVQFVRELRRPKIRTKREDIVESDDLADVPNPIESVQFEKAAAAKFCHFLGASLENDCQNERFNSLVLCAEPQLLTILEENLGTCSRAKVAGTVNVDLYEVNESDLLDYVKDICEREPGRVA